jgi:hypothetical protein
VSSSTVDIQKDVVVKSGDVDLMRVEVAKTIGGYEIAESCGLFRAPKVLDYNEEAGIVTLERLQDIEPVMPTVAFMKNSDHVLKRMAESLAVIHRSLTLPDNMKVALPRELSLEGQTQVFLHGDFNGTNVCIDNRNQSIAILDWQMTSIYGETATYGTRYFDLTWFLNHLFVRPLHRYMFAQPAAPAARLFLQSYFKALDIDCPFQEVWEYMKRFFERRLAQRKRTLSPAKRLLLALANARLMAFLKDVGTPEPRY